MTKNRGDAVANPWRYSLSIELGRGQITTSLAPPVSFQYLNLEPNINVGMRERNDKGQYIPRSLTAKTLSILERIWALGIAFPDS